MTHSIENLAVALIESATRNALRPAVIDDDGMVTYRQLFMRAGGFARAIDTRVDPTGIVAVKMSSGVELYAAVLGAVLSGRPFCTLNPAEPEKRRAAMLEVLKPALLITDNLDLRSTGALTSHQVPDGDFSPCVCPAEIIYVLFTSGSTGVPKGVRVAGSAAVAFLNWALEFYQPSPEDRWSQFNVPTFDLSLVDLFVALLGGASLVPFHSPVDRLRPTRKVTRLGVTVWHAVPSTIQMLLEGGRVDGNALRRVRLFSFCGEPLLTHLVAQLLRVAEAARAVNTYGPTEGTFFCTAHEVTLNDLQSGKSTIPLGRAIPGWSLDLIPRECEGDALYEIAIAGEFIGRGYLGDVQGGFFGESGRPTSFLTGDLVREVDGELYFHSRIDRQRKVRGVRLELGEVERAAWECGLGNCVAEVQDGRLLLFVSREESSIGDLDLLEKRLNAYLPEPMLPSAIVVVDRFPRTASAKIDVRRLLTDHGGC